MLHATIMAGGSGTRFWPSSRAKLPKQLLPLAGSETLLQDTVRRLRGLIPPERTLIVTNNQLTDAVEKQLPELPSTAFVGEPCKRDTAPCIGLAALLILQQDSDATMAVMPSDHVIDPTKSFQRALLQAKDLVDQSPDRLVTFGIRPSTPSSSYGYIQQAEPLAHKENDAPVHRVAQFREKPPVDVAKEYLAAGNFLWNAGIFVWRAKTIIEALEKHQPECLLHLKRIVENWNTPQRNEVFSKEFAAIKGVSIDYAVLEHAAEVAVIEAPFTWDDLGGWSAVARQRGQDDNGNTVVGRHLGIESKNVLVHTSDDHLVVTLGLDNILLVHTEDATLVADRSHEEHIRKVVTELESKAWHEFL